jgi:hypothetical protein
MIHPDCPDCKLAYSVREAAAACSCRPFPIRKAINNFEITPRRIGKRSVLSRDDLLRWINSRPRTKSSLKRRNLPDG